MKKLFIFLLLTIFLFSIVSLTGCASENSKSSNKEVETLKIDEDLSQVTIRLGLSASGKSRGNPPAFKKQVDEMLTVLNKKAQEDGLNVTIKIQWLSDTYSTDAIGKVPQCDVYQAQFFDATELYEQGSILKLNDLINNNFPTYNSILKSNTISNDYERFFGIKDLKAEPIYFLFSNYVNTDVTGVLMEKDIAEKYNIDISTLSDYVQALRKIKEGGETDTPGIFLPIFYVDEYMKEAGYYKTFNSLLFYSKFGASDFTVYPVTQIEEYKKAMESYQNLKKEKLVGDLKDPYMELAMGSTCSILVPVSGFITNKYTFRKGKEFVMFPINKKKQKQNALNTGLVVSSSTQNPERVMLFLEWLYSNKENMDIWQYGGFTEEKNSYYTLDDKNRISYNKVESPFYSWLRDGARNFLFDMNSMHPPHYLPETFINDYTDLLNVNIKERNMNNLKMPYEEGSEDYNNYFKTQTKLFKELQSYYKLSTKINDILKTADYDLDKYIKELKDAGIEDTAKGFSDLYNGVMDK